MSSAIARLERDLGVQMFDRGVMSVARTKQGVALQASAQRILDAVQAARDDVAAVSGQIRGNSTRSRNARLAAFHSLTSVIALWLGHKKTDTAQSMQTSA